MNSDLICHSYSDQEERRMRRTIDKLLGLERKMKKMKILR